MKSIEQRENTQELTRKDTEAGRIAWSLSVAATALASVLAVGNMHTLGKPNGANFNYIYPDVGSITIDNGADFLSEPKTDSSKGSYVLYKLNLDGTDKTINVPTPGGVIEFYSPNGKLIGIKTDQLPPELQAKVESDTDGIIWVDGQDAVENPNQQ